jgi:hypothetical protein
MRHVSRGASCHRYTVTGLFDWRIGAVSLCSLAGVATLGATLAIGTALFALPSPAFAQESASSRSSDAGPVALADTMSAAATAPETAAADSEDDAPAQVLNTPADVVSMNDVPLDDQVLARQRGGASGLTMIAATPDRLRGSSVTLWDEIAPPAPLPVPVDAARAAQSNVASYLRK